MRELIRDLLPGLLALLIAVPLLWLVERVEKWLDSRPDAEPPWH